MQYEYYLTKPKPYLHVLHIFHRAVSRALYLNYDNYNTPPF
jgi:hypothetical protein